MKNDQLLELTNPVACRSSTIATLASWSEKNVLASRNLTLSTYSTVRMLTEDIDCYRYKFSLYGHDCELSLSIEQLPLMLEYLVRKQNATPLVQNKSRIKEVNCVLISALQSISDVAPYLFESIRYLLRTIHLLSPPCPDYDVSFSLPELPHSIFISVPFSSEKNIIMRTAEAIIHEVLHLQLNLVELQQPLVYDNTHTEWTYAPWRDEDRPISSVIHGLFVFQGIESFYRKSLDISDTRSTTFISDRIFEIEKQRSLLKQPNNFKSLTPFGYSLYQRLVD